MSRRAGFLAKAALAVSLLVAPCGATAEGLPEGGLLHTPFGEALAGRLVADGFDRGRVEALLGDKRLAINGTTLAYAIVYRESPADYSKFLLEERLSRARAFIAANRELLAAATARSGVPGEVIAAILMIESDFGAYRKLHPVLNVFATLLWAAEPANFETVLGAVRKRLPDVTPEKVRERSKAKAKWAYEQLTYLVRIAEREKIDLPALEGSWAGAFGMSQFIPSSYWGYAVDGDGDGRADLYTAADAVFSVGNYLKSFGWRNGLSEEKRRAVVRRYNNSELYAATVLEAAARLREGAAQTP
ncbi:MAG: lytic murein transglycosylase [Candidatus Methylomirabilia bacterium]